MAEAAGQLAKDERTAGKRGFCVRCGRPRDPRYDPFCSRRCADVDLHRWLTGGYVLAGGEPARRQDDAET